MSIEKIARGVGIALGAVGVLYMLCSSKVENIHKKNNLEANALRIEESAGTRWGYEFLDSNTYGTVITYKGKDGKLRQAGLRLNKDDSLETYSFDNLKPASSSKSK
ncbi:MAG: hypothetical protein AABW51_02195 [Nanoarchaeota archaeon]